jgi:hypothetical protein
VAAGLPEGLDPCALDTLREQRSFLLAEVRRLRPADGTDEELPALLRLARFSLSSMHVLGQSFVDVFRGGVNTALGELLRKELEAAETERKLALRQIEQALHTFGVLIESVGAVMAGMPEATLRTWLYESAERASAPNFVLAPGERVILRFELDLTMALDSLDGPLEELTHWAFRAVAGARRVEALPSPIVPAGLHGELARVRSRSAWRGWDADEIERELAPWPPGSPLR